MQLKFKQLIRHVQSPRVEELLKEAAESNAISLAGGLPSEDLFPTEAIEAAFEKVITEHSSEALQYAWSDGYQPLREQICTYMQTRGIKADPSEILITHGIQQGLDLLTRLMADTGDPILVENPTYVSAVNAFELQKARFLTVDRTEAGLDTKQLENILQSEKPKFFYLSPTGHNPVGNTLSDQQRQEILALSENYNLPILEDAAYADLEYDQPQKFLKAYENSKNVIFLGSFSKILSPGLRVGWIMAGKKVIEQLVLIKQAADLQTSSLSQLVLSLYLKENSLEDHIKTCLDFYRGQRDTMLEAIGQYFPDNIKHSKPSSAFSVWAELPAGTSAVALLKAAMESGVAFEPGEVYFPNTKPGNFFRLSFSNTKAGQVTEGIRLLGSVLADYKPGS